jgi:hypothetical protein
VSADDLDDDVQAAIVRELRLLDPAVRCAPDEVAALLDPDFSEFDASGRRWTRQEIIDALPVEEASPRQGLIFAVSDLAGVSLAEGIVHVTYTSQGQARRCHRSSIWWKTPTGWRIYFHQSTVVPDG